MSAEDEILSLLLQFFAGNRQKVAAWLNMANPLLGGFVPNDMIAMGRKSRLLEILKQRLSENEP